MLVPLRVTNVRTSSGLSSFGIEYWRLKVGKDDEEKGRSKRECGCEETCFSRLLARVLLRKRGFVQMKPKKNAINKKKY